MTITICICKRCGHNWATRKKWELTKNKKPFVCPRCKTPRWDDYEH